MDKIGYMTLKKQLSFDRSLWVTLAIIAGDVCLAGGAFWLLSLGGVLSYVASQCMLTLFYFHNFALLHECGHENVHRKRWVNTLIGHYVSIFCFMPFYPWKLIHQQHHLWAGNIDKDPTMKNVKKMREKGTIPLPMRVTWRVWVPVAALSQHFVFWFYPFTLGQSGKMTRSTLMQSLFSVLWLAVVYYGLFTYLPAWINLGNLWLSFMLYLIMTELVNFPHHLMMPSFHTSEKRAKLHPWEQHITTRTCYYPYGLAFLTLNFNLHTEHHFYPGLPWFRLPALRDALKDMLGDEYNETYGINWNLENRKRDPRQILLTEVSHPALS